MVNTLFQKFRVVTPNGSPHKLLLRAGKEEQLNAPLRSLLYFMNKGQTKLAKGSKIGNCSCLTIYISMQSKVVKRDVTSRKLSRARYRMQHSEFKSLPKHHNNTRIREIKNM